MPKPPGLWSSDLVNADYERIEFDLSLVTRNMAGPQILHARVSTSIELSAKGIAHAEGEAVPESENGLMPDGAVIIAAITSCTNTSNPRNVVAAALLAKKPTTWQLP